MKKMKKILIIDDDQSMVSNMIDVLYLEGYEAQSVNESCHALDRAKVYQPDLILSDVRMPGMDGYAILEALRQESATANIPLVFLTGLDAADMVMQPKPDGVLTKPFSIDELLSIIHQYVD